MIQKIKEFEPSTENSVFGSNYIFLMIFTAILFCIIIITNQRINEIKGDNVYLKKGELNMIDFIINCSSKNMAITIEDYRHFADDISIYWGENFLEEKIGKIKELLKVQSIKVTLHGNEVSELTLERFNDLLNYIEQHDKQSKEFFEEYLKTTEKYRK